VARVGEPNRGARRGPALSRYEVRVEAANGELRSVARPRLFELGTLGEGGWLKAMRLEGYAPRAPRRPRSHAEAL